MMIFETIVWALGLIAVSTGANNLVRGASVKADFGNLGDAEKDPTLNFTIRFLGAIWTGFGILLVLFATNLHMYQVPLILCFCIIIVGGIGRMISVKQFGIAKGREMLSYAIVGVELILVPILLAWFLLFGLSR